MCNISIFEPFVLPPKEWLDNAVYNNWHSYGIVVRDGKSLKTYKEVPESGEVDPDVVYKILKDNIDKERFMHVRHNTAGATTMDNCHPFTIFKNSKEEIVFFHNGTMYDYKSKKVVNGAAVDDDDGPSDTQNFVNQILIPFFRHSKFGEYVGHLSHPFMKMMLTKLWPASGQNRGLFVSNLDPNFLRLGDSTATNGWKKVGQGDQEFWSSNGMDYFTKVTRGPEHSRRLVREEAEKKARAAAEADKTPAQEGGSTSFTGGALVRLADFRPNARKALTTLKHSILGLTDDFSFFDRPGMVSVGAATRDELIELHSDKQICLDVMELVFTDYAVLYDEHLKLKTKHETATKMVADEIERNKRLIDEALERKVG